jgi:hypothetical protein
MDDQLNDDITCGSIDSTSHGIHIRPQVNFHKKNLRKNFFLILVINNNVG